MEIKATREEKLQALKDWEVRRKESEEQIAKLEDLIGVSFESPFIEAVRKLQDADMKITAKIAGDTEEWLDWYCYENSMGTDGMGASINGRDIIITDVEQLLSAIEFPLAFTDK